MQFFLIRVQTVNTTLQLSRGSSELESDLTTVNGSSQFLARLDTNVLQRVLQTVEQVWNELGDRTLVDNGTRNTLSDQNLVGLGEVTRGRGVGVGGGLLHGIDGTHTTVGLQSLTVTVEVVTWGLGGTSQQTTHHHTGSTQSQGLGDVSDVTNTTIGDTWNTELACELADVVDGGTLRSTTGHNLLGDTDGTRTHTDSQTIGTSLNQQSSLLSGNDVTGNDLQFRVGGLDPLDHVQLENGRTVRGVQDDDVQTSLNQLGQSLSVSLDGTDSSTTQQLLGVERLGGVWVVLVLLQVGQRDEGDQITGLVNNWQLTLLGGSQQRVTLGQSDALLGGDQVGGHNFGDDGGVVLVELNVTGGDNTNKLGAWLTGL